MELKASQASKLGLHSTQYTISIYFHYYSVAVVMQICERTVSELAKLLALNENADKCMMDSHYRCGIFIGMQGCGIYSSQ